MLETRTPPVSTLPRPTVRPSQRAASARTSSARTSSARTVPARTVPARIPLAPPPIVRERERRVPTAPRTAAQRATQARLARSEARLLTVAVPATALLCAVLVLYLAAYAHVSQLGVDQAQARVQLRQERSDNDQLEARLAALQSPSHIAAAAQALGMTAGAKRVTYLLPQRPQTQTLQTQTLQTQNPQTLPDNGARNVQVAIGGTTADTPPTDGH